MEVVREQVDFEAPLREWTKTALQKVCHLRDNAHEPPEREPVGMGVGRMHGSHEYTGDVSGPEGKSSQR